MTIEHVVKVGAQVARVVGRSVGCMQVELVNGRRARYYPAANKVVFRHSITGKFTTKQV